MPHVIVQASPNVTINDPNKLLKQLNTTLWETGHFDKPQAIKARLLTLDTFLVGIDDEQDSEAFVYLQLRLMPGRSQEIRDDLAERLFGCLQRELDAQQADTVVVRYGVEVVELAEAYRKTSLSDL